MVFEKAGLALGQAWVQIMVLRATGGTATVVGGLYEGLSSALISMDRGCWTGER